MTTSMIESGVAAEAIVDTGEVVESSPDTESGTVADSQKHSPVTGIGTGGGLTGFPAPGGTSPQTTSGGEAVEADAAGSGAENSEFETESGWSPSVATETRSDEETALDAAFAETDSQEFIQFLAPLVGPLLSTVLPAAAKGLAGTVAPSLLQRLFALFGQRPAVKAAVRREFDESVIAGEASMEVDEAMVAEAIQQLETVLGVDDRVRITSTHTVPWKRICHLVIKAGGRTFTGTGWFIGPRTIATAGHCVYLHGAGGWAESIKVVPGRNGSQMPYGESVATRYSSVLGWTVSKDSNYDYGVVHLDRPFPAMDIGTFGFANFDDSRLRSSRLNLAGYPGDKPLGTLWYHGRNATSVTPTRINYDIDTYGGQSGSPVWVRTTDGRRYAVGIHTNGSLRGNSATRINREVFANLKTWSRS